MVIKIAKSARSIRVNVVNLNVRVVHAANFTNDNIFLVNLFGELIHSLVAALADGFVHLHLQHQVAATL